MKTTALIGATDVSDDPDDDIALPALNDNRQRWTPPAKPQKGPGSNALPNEAYNLTVRQATRAIPWDEGGTQSNVTKAATIDMLEALDPQDAIESMLAAQMVALHNVTMDCARRAGFSTGPDRDTALHQANKASRTFGMLVETLNKHRGKGRQTMVVEHVHVHQGGQAIVGQVKTCAGGDAEK